MSKTSNINGEDKKGEEERSKVFEYDVLSW
jgi:hypothetical protein